MTKYVGYIAMSLDGFIADSEGSVGWLDPFNALLEGDTSYAAFIADVDAVLMGRTTHEQVIGWGWPYEDRANYVLTHQAGYVGDHVTAAGDIDTLRGAIDRAGHKRVWVIGGGEAQRAALDAGMFDRLQVFVMPTILGGGKPLFAPGTQHNLTLASCHDMAGGILNITYHIKD